MPNARISFRKALMSKDIVDFAPEGKPRARFFCDRRPKLTGKQESDPQGFDRKGIVALEQKSGTSGYTGLG